MIRRTLLALLFLAPFAASAQLKPGVPVAGKDYIVLAAAQPTWGTGGIEVAEVFSYSCIHCAEFQPMVNAWKKKLPADVKFVYVPAVFGGVWDNSARAFFAAEALGWDGFFIISALIGLPALVILALLTRKLDR